MQVGLCFIWLRIPHADILVFNHILSAKFCSQHAYRNKLPSLDELLTCEIFSSKISIKFLNQEKGF